MPADAAAEPLRFGKYQILERVASGGMAEIFRARLDGIAGFQRSFAIKRIAPHLSQNHEFVDMLVDEAKVAGLLSHANIVQILDLGSVDQQFYIAMEFVNGRDLGQILARCADKGITLPVPHAVFVLLEMLKGLEYAHQRQVMRGGRPVPLNIVHRDISPGNVLVSFQGEVKLTDFGIAKASVRALETMSGVVKGRFDYMSPEQALAQPLDQRADLFSAGVLLYELLTGRHPFRQAGEIATLEAVRKGGYVPPSEVNPDVPYTLDLVVEHALRVRPEDRVPTATAFKEALDRFFHDSGFIFSASTLAAFLRGLFPEAAPQDRRPAGEAPTRPLDPDELLLDDDEPSGGSQPRTGGESVGQGATVARAGPRPGSAGEASQSSPTIREPLPFAAAGPAVSSTALGMLRGSAAVIEAHGDDRTLIRPARKPPTAVENPFGDVNTVIRQPDTAGDHATTVQLALSANQGEATPLRQTPQRVPPPPVVADLARRPAGRPTRGATRVPMEVHAAWMLVAFACTVLAFVVGLLCGSRLANPAPPRPDPTMAPPPEN
jgi:serine/threonine-protein kinase